MLKLSEFPYLAPCDPIAQPAQVTGPGQKPGVCDNGACYGNSLLLPAAQLRAALAAKRVVALWQFRYKVVGVGLACCSLDLLRCRILLAIADVLCNAQAVIQVSGAFNYPATVVPVQFFYARMHKDVNALY